MTKQQLEKIKIIEEIIDRINWEDDYLFYPATRWSVKPMNFVKTIASISKIEIEEDVEYNQYGTTITGRTINGKEKLKLFAENAKKMINEIENGQKIKNQKGATKRGEVSVTRGAIKTWNSRNSNESYQDAIKRAELYFNR